MTTTETPPRTRVTIRTSHARPTQVAAALEPDNTTEMVTRISEDQVVTEINRPTAGGLRSTLDDYLVNLTVADRLTADTDDTIQ